MRFVRRGITITYMDGHITPALPALWFGGCIDGREVKDGVLTLTRKNGEGAPVEHVGSFPLVNIRHWKVTDR
jgi:hypothetical protein